MIHSIRNEQAAYKHHADRLRCRSSISRHLVPAVRHLPCVWWVTMGPVPTCWRCLRGPARTAVRNRSHPRSARRSSAGSRRMPCPRC